MTVFEEMVSESIDNFDRYETFEMDGLKFHRVGHNASHYFAIAKLGPVVVIYAWMPNTDDVHDPHSFRIVEDEDLRTAYLGHW